MEMTSRSDLILKMARKLGTSGNGSDSDALPNLNKGSHTTRRMDEIWITKNENDGESEYGSHSEASSDLTEEQIAAAKELEDILNEQENSQNLIPA
ncbi:hypothetical protein LSTR_LSTR011781 [Laodelphax striatellus]|uniref:Uncharacterized protein n=1 Tax=Laodelphax striatellus TaxID=195883 RepID=A0A482XLH5_LAOST|nr:hypothetical protein LSTR_LSTR011781 [Laodelphax striatellus]